MSGDTRGQRYGIRIVVAACGVVLVGIIGFVSVLAVQAVQR